MKCSEPRPGQAGQMMIMFVVIKQSVFDQELSDTECVQVLAGLGLVLVLDCWSSNAKTSKTGDWRLLAKFSLLELALHQQLFIRFLGNLALWQCTTATTEIWRPATMQLQLILQLYPAPRTSNFNHSWLVFQHMTYWVQTL